MQQASAIPLRLSAGIVEVCLITSARRQRWGFPKGIIDPGETAEQTALKESFEEAGIRGTLWPEPLGSYVYSKWQRQLSVLVFVLSVEEVAEDWPEATLRQRIWLPPNEARQLVTRNSLRQMLDEAVMRVEGSDE